MESHDNNADVVWKDVIGFEGIYQISKYGQIKRIKRTQRKSKKKSCVSGEFILKEWFSRAGYINIQLAKGDGSRVKKSFMVHRLVAIHFIPNPHNYPFVDHINNIKLDCFYRNLRWCTPKMNVEYMFEAGRANKVYGDKHYRAILTADDVIEIKRLYLTGEYTHRQLGKMYKIDRTAIGAALGGKTWKQAFANQ